MRVRHVTLAVQNALSDGRLSSLFEGFFQAGNLLIKFLHFLNTKFFWTITYRIFFAEKAAHFTSFFSTVMYFFFINCFLPNESEFDGSFSKDGFLHSFRFHFHFKRSGSSFFLNAFANLVCFAIDAISQFNATKIISGMGLGLSKR